MALKSKVVVVPLEGRDKGKHFIIEEMPASQAEEWALRAFLALSNAGIEVPDDLAAAGLAGLAVIGLRALGRVRFEDAKPLLDQMMSCVQAMPDPKTPTIIRGLVETDIEEMQTRLWLRGEVFELHTGFSLAGVAMTFQGAPADGEEPKPSTMSMFRRSSGQ